MSDEEKIGKRQRTVQKLKRPDKGVVVISSSLNRAFIPDKKGISGSDSESVNCCPTIIKKLHCELRGIRSERYQRQRQHRQTGG